jgi:DNA repair protein RecO (recombination protein O)
MEWEAPAVVLDARPHGEGDAVATVMTEEYGAHRGLARGGSSRSKAALWMPGNLVQVRWVGRLSEQLGSFSAEMIHPAAAFALAEGDRLPLSMLASLCAVAEGALPEREAHPRVFDALVHIIARLPKAEAMMPELVRWEAMLLSELGYGMDFSACPVTGTQAGLAWVSPRTGRAISDEAAGEWKARLLRLPPLVLGGVDGGPADWRDGLALTGHFLARDVFGLRHLPLPRARTALYDHVVTLIQESPPCPTTCQTP